MNVLHPAALIAALTAALPFPARVAAQPPAFTPGDSAAGGAPLSRAERARYLGHFTLTDSTGASPTPLRVFEERGALLGQLRANTPSRLVFEGRHTFHPADAPGFRLVFTVAGPRATRVEVRGPGLVLAGARDAGAAPPLAGARPSAGADSSRSGALYDELAHVDSLLFDASYVRCDTARVNALLTDDVEFYHDLTGLHRGAEVRADFARLAQHCPAAKGVRREVVPGSLRVYPVRGVGAVQMGEHRFVERGAASAGSARFVHVWLRDGGAWKASRILSLDHHATDATAPP